MRRGILGLFVVAVIGCVSSLLFPMSHASAAVGINPTLSFEGKIVNTNGTNIPDGTYNMEFKIYQDGTNTGSGSTLKWTEDRLVGGTPVTVTNGVFQVELGSLTSFGASVDWNQSVLWLSMQLGNTSSCTIVTNFQTNCAGDGEMTPFIRLTSSPYAMNADKLDGLDSTAFAQLTADQTFVGNTIHKSATNSATAFQIQNSSATDILNIDTTDTNLITNPGFEVNATGWTAAGTTAPTRDTGNKYLGFGSGTVAGVTAAGEGFKQVLSTTLSNGTYTISWWDKMVSGPAFTDVMAAYSVTGGAPVNCTGMVSQTVVTTGWTKHSCQISVTSASSANYITIRQVGVSTARTWNIDGVQLVAGSTATAYGAGTAMLNAVLTSPLSVQNSENSTTALDVKNAAGSSILTLDTVNNGLTLAADTTLNAQADLRLADSDSSNWVAFQAPATVASNVTWTLPSADSAGCFKSDGAGTLSIATCGDIKTETITATGGGTWTKATGAILVMVDAVGGGGGGGGGASNTGAVVRTGGSGGGGGAHAFKNFNASDLGGTENYNVGIGGTAGTAGASGGSGGDGGLGGNTTFGTTVRLAAGGGGGGKKGDNSALVGGGGGGGGSNETGVGVTGGVGTTVGGAGGFPGTGTLATIGFGGAIGAITATTGGLAEWGGAGGGGHTAVPANGPGGTSVHGGGGGGTGGGATVAPAVIAPQAGGASGVWTAAGGGGGAAGTSGAAPTVGTAGAAGSGTALSGSGGGGGGSTVTANTAGAAGGAGGVLGGGGGGGGSGSNTGGGGLGGVGGRGELHIWTIKGTGADLAEIYGTNDGSIDSGDVVSLDPSLIAGVKKSGKAYDSTAFGIISTAPSLVMGSLEDKDAKPVMVALSGRVPVKVNLENGPINPGDFLTPSSTPGVAMKATKAGQIIGQAMIAYTGDTGAAAGQVGTITAFVKNQQGNGSKLSDLVTGIPTGSATPDVTDQSKVLLANFVTNKEQLAASDSISEITTDRLSAGLEIITPTVKTDTVSTNTINASTGNDISVVLGDNSKFIVKGKSGVQSFSIDSIGNASFVADLVAFGDMESKGGLVVDGKSQFNGKTTFASLATFLDDVSLQGNVDAQGRITFNKDTGGFAVMHTGSSRVDIKFSHQYATPPVITASLYADQAILPDGTKEDLAAKEQRLFAAGYSFIVSDVNPQGFTIVLNKTATEDIKFNWSAVAIKDPTTTESTPDPVNAVQ